MINDWDDAYANGAHIEGAADYPPRWAEAAAGFRASLGARARLDLPYGPAERNRFDLFLPEGTPRRLTVFIHGGYWRAFDKSAWSWLAAGPLRLGLPQGMKMTDLIVIGFVAAIGFTVSLFIAAVAFDPGPIQDAAKMGALFSFFAAALSIAAGVVFRVEKQN